MAIVFSSSDTPIIRGIKTVGIGKKGSQSLTPELAHEILADLKADKVTPAARGAFFAGLFFKGIEPSERVLDEAFKEPGTLFDPQRLVRVLCGDVHDDIQNICQNILEHKSMDRSTAFLLGQFLMSDLPGDSARGLVASALRVRYETDDEYEGLLQAINETIVEKFRKPSPFGEPIIQLAEPFDGNDHSMMITPLVGQYLQSLNYRVVHLVGRNSGPKMILNLADVAQLLEATCLTTVDQLNKSKPTYGWFIHQKDVSPPLDRWVDLRRQTIKRPFLATLEKFLNPAGAQIIAASAFHPPYGEKMLTIAERAGCPAVIIVRNGIEGSLAFSLKRETRILCSCRMNNGSYQRHEIVFDASKFLGQVPDVEERLVLLTALDNARLIQEFQKNQKTSNVHFDARVRATCEGFRLALGWIEGNLSKK